MRRMYVLEIQLRWDLPRVELQLVTIVLLVSFGSSFTLFPHCKALPFYLNTSSVPSCLVHNCETSWRLVISICYHPCFEIKFPLIPHQQGERPSLYPEDRVWTIADSAEQLSRMVRGTFQRVFLMDALYGNTVIWQILIARLGSPVVVVDESWRRVYIIFGH